MKQIIKHNTCYLINEKIIILFLTQYDTHTHKILVYTAKYRQHQLQNVEQVHAQSLSPFLKWLITCFDYQHAESSTLT